MEIQRSNASLSLQNNHCKKYNTFELSKKKVQPHFREILIRTPRGGGNLFLLYGKRYIKKCAYFLFVACKWRNKTFNKKNHSYFESIFDLSTYRQNAWKMLSFFWFFDKVLHSVCGQNAFFKTFSKKRFAHKHYGATFKKMKKSVYFFHLLLVNWVNKIILKKRFAHKHYRNCIQKMNLILDITL